MRTLVLILSSLALPALAETPLEINLETNLPYLEKADVAGGSLEIVTADLGGFEGTQLVFNGEPVVGIADKYVNIQGVIPRPEFEGEDLVFVTLAGGGNECPTLWAIVVTSAAGAKASKPFGTCSEAILYPRLTNDALVSFNMSPVAEDQPWMAYTVDGSEIWEVALAAPP